MLADWMPGTAFITEWQAVKFFKLGLSPIAAKDKLNSPALGQLRLPQKAYGTA